MFNYISGQLAEINPAYAVVDCHGVGYQIEITLNTYSQIKDMSEVKLLTHYVVREDAHLLYGFYTAAERDMFRKLIAITGVGTNTARMVLSSLTVDELRQAVVSHNVKAVQSVKGIGAKGAQRIILELQDKVDTLPAETMAALYAGGNNAQEALAALSMLGFAKPAAEKALQAVTKQNPTASVEELIKLSLKML
ncbi:MAG: Holliday junction branch migration protein RuvA [Bacteroidales bacterium]|nr:Holliday junction branch migration protein RuvA [Bacteroidales bacterium]